MSSEAHLVIQLIIMIVLGGICAAIASSKGRNVVGWFFVGFFAGCIGLIIILCLSNLTAEEARWQQSQNEQRRLREQLKQERLKNEAFQGHVRGRLDAHDQALAIDTRSVTALPERAAPSSLEFPDQVPPQLDGPAAEPPLQRQLWSVRKGDRQSSPVVFERLRKNYHLGFLDENTLVKSDTMLDWAPIRSIPGLLELLV